MGMSNDYATAIAEGSTMVRIGTAIFGERVKSKVLIRKWTLINANKTLGPRKKLSALICVY